jgi:hypothetical protein
MKAGDWDTAIAYLAPLAQQGVRCATLNLGSSYVYSVVKEDYSAAREQILRNGFDLMKSIATTSGVCQAQAQYTIGKCLDVYGYFESALPWYEMAANANYSLALFDLGMMYFNGDGTRQDYKKAYSLLLRAANRGHAEAQFNVALMLGQGKGVGQDLESAHMWALIGWCQDFCV